MRNARRGYAIIAVALSLALCALVGEIVLGYTYKYAHHKMRLKYRGRELCTMRADDSRLLYTYIPNKCDFNSKGYRDNERQYEKGAADYRIVIIGDSVAEGLSKTDRFGTMLENKLNESSQSMERHYEVVVLARSGYSTSQELIILENEAFQYHPDLILWSYVLNDPAHPVYHNANGELGRFWYQPRYYTLHFVQKQIFLLREKLHGLTCAQEFHQFLHCVYHRQIEEHLKKLSVVSKARRVRVILLIHPVFEQDTGRRGYGLVNVHKMLQTIAVSQGLIAWDLYEAFYGNDPNAMQDPGASHGYDPWHPNLQGHTIMADYLYRKFMQGQFGTNPQEE